MSTTGASFSARCRRQSTKMAVLSAHFLRPGLFKCAMKAADLAVRRPPRPPRPRFILALFRTIFTLAALAICQSTSPSSLSPSQTRTSACSHRINAFDYHVPFLNETALAASLSLYQSIDRPSTAMYQTHPPHFPTTLDLGICTHQSEPVHSHVSATHKRHADSHGWHRHRYAPLPPTTLTELRAASQPPPRVTATRPIRGKLQ